MNYCKRKNEPTDTVHCLNCEPDRASTVPDGDMFFRKAVESMKKE